jgi:hypothetical protein
MIPAGNPSMTLARRANHRAAAQLAGLAGWPGARPDNRQLIQ